MHRLAIPILLCLLSLPLWLGDAVAGGRVEVRIEFTPHEIAVIREYYTGQRGGPPGRRGGLPPGIARNLERGKPLPPGLARQQLPEGLRHQLPPAPRGYERIEIDGRILLVEIATRVIHDVLTDIFVN